MSSKKKGKKDGEIIEESRFSKLHTDRRFMKAPNFKKELREDPRFAALHTDKRFGFSGEKDIYGRDASSSEDEEEDYFSAEEEIAGPLHKNLSSDNEAASDNENDFPYIDIRGENIDSDVSDSDSDDLSDEESEAKEDIEYGEETDRIAVVNCDFQNLKAVDLLMIFNSFLPTDGYIKNVTIYPSDFGLKMKEEELLHGPRVWKDKKITEGKYDDDDDDGIDLKKLRNYEMNKLKYYFAVVTCNNINTASKLYKALNDHEIENTANKLDLRFIPEQISFEGREIKDSSESLPSNYSAPRYETKALQSTKPVLTWDQLPTERASITQKRFTKDQIREMDFQAYLAEESSDEESDNENQRSKFSSLLGDFHEDGDDEYPEDMEIVFTEKNIELDEKIKELVEKKKNNENKTVFDDYMEKQRQKKKEKRERKNKKEEEINDSLYSDEEDNIKKKSRRTKKRKIESEDEVDEQDISQLSLLVSSKSHDKKSGKDEDKHKEVDLTDERFQRLITDSRFHLDPTHPLYKKTKTNEKIIKERQKFRKTQHK